MNDFAPFRHGEEGARFVGGNIHCDCGIEAEHVHFSEEQWRIMQANSGNGNNVPTDKT